ncbi:MAG: hypothetical protein ACLFV3_10245 [Phycisphaeraceae bacterium]
MPNAIRMICPNLKCRAMLSVPVTARGKTVRCRQCRTHVEVPLEKRPDPAATETGAPSTG